MTEYLWPTWEELKPSFSMPDPTVDRNGSLITTEEEWEEERKYRKAMFAHYMFGHYPKERGPVAATVTEKRTAFDGKAVEEWVTLTFGTAKKIPMGLRFIYPNKEGKHFPLIITSTDYINDRLPLEEKAVTEYGFALAAFDRSALCGDRSQLEAVLQYRAGTLQPKDEAVLRSVTKFAAVAPETVDLEHLHPLMEAYPGYDWGEIAQWGFGYLAATDYFETLSQIDTEKICFTGHSRLGKSALCAGIYDERASIVNPNASGCGGVGSLRFLGPRSGLCQDPDACEAVGGITNFAPDWFVKEFASFGDNAVFPERESHLPFDANTLRAAVAPRACFTTEGLDDYWSNPCGTQFAWEDAMPLFEQLGIPEKNGIHYREGGHAHNALDWQALFTYCRFLWFGEPLSEDINKPYFKR